MLFEVFVVVFLNYLLVYFAFCRVNLGAEITENHFISRKAKIDKIMCVEIS